MHLFLHFKFLEIFTLRKDIVSELNTKIFLFKSFFKELDFKFKNKNLFYESKLLQLNSNKAKKLLRWKTRLNIKETINFTCRWYQLYLKKNLPEQITLNQIKEYLKHVEKK